MVSMFDDNWYAQEQDARESLLHRSKNEPSYEPSQVFKVLILLAINKSAREGCYKADFSTRKNQAGQQTRILRPLCAQP